jgi:hypothetical protein
MGPYVAGESGEAGVATLLDVPADAEVCPRLSAILGWLTELAGRSKVPPQVSDRERIDRTALMERLKSAAAAVPAAEMVRFGVSPVALQRADVDPRAVGRGIADQIALACKVSPTEGSRRLATARTLHCDLPATRALLGSGEIREHVAQLVVSETGHLDAATRRAPSTPRSQPLALPPCRRSALQRVRVGWRTARTRSAPWTAAEPSGGTAGWLRPAPDTMSLLTAYLPVEQGVAAWSALKHHADGLMAGGDSRTRGQVMADTLVERLTGHVCCHRRAPGNRPGHAGRRPCRPRVRRHSGAGWARTHSGTAGSPDSLHQRRPEVLAAAVHPAGRRHRRGGRHDVGGGRPPPTPVRRLASRFHPAARPTLPRPLLRCAHPPSRPHHPAQRRRGPPRWRTGEGSAPAATMCVSCPAGT